MARIEDEIKQSRPFRSLESEALIALARTQDLLQRPYDALLKQQGLSSTQYNVLRILRGAGAQGLSCSEIAARMYTRDPDITRLLDRLEKAGLVARGREQEDRRVVTSRITQRGLGVLAELDGPIDQLDRKLLHHMGDERLRQLVDLLQQVREQPG